MTQFNFQNHVCFERLMHFSKTPYILWQFYISKLAPLLIFCHVCGYHARSYETVTDKFRPSVAFDLTIIIRTPEAQRWPLVGTSVAGLKAAAIGWTFDEPASTVRRHKTFPLASPCFLIPATPCPRRRFRHDVVAHYPELQTLTGRDPG